MDARSTSKSVSDVFDPHALGKWFDGIQAWLLDNLISYHAGVQLFIILAALAVAWFLHRPLHSWAAKPPASGSIWWIAARLKAAVADLSLPAVWLVLLSIAFLVTEKLKMATWLTEIVVSLVTAWIVIRFASQFIANRFFARLVFLMVWAIAALSILDLLDPTVAFLDKIAFTAGDTRISLLTIVIGVFALTGLVWAAFAATGVAQRYIDGVDAISPSGKVLLGQLLRIVAVTVAVIAGLSFIGVDITAFAIFTGALGVGIGLGLQKVVSNLFSGLLLLVDKSVKPGDVIAVGDTYGWVNYMGARYVSVVTMLGIEFLIPNDSLISQRVENWSYSDDLLGLTTPIGISYSSDLHKAIALAVESAAVHERVLADPAPRCLVKAFGDSAIDLELYMWIRDPKNGIANVRSEVLLGVWDRFAENDIKIPYPQRDVHIIPAEAPTV